MLTRRCSERNHCPLMNVRFLIRDRIPPDSGVPQTYPMVDEYSAPRSSDGLGRLTASSRSVGPGIIRLVSSFPNESFDNRMFAKLLT